MTSPAAHPDTSWMLVQQLQPHPSNPYTHPPEQLDQLADSLEEYGQGRTVLAHLMPGESFDPLASYPLLAGHGLSAGFQRLIERHGGSYTLPGAPAPNMLLVRPVALPPAKALGLIAMDNESDQLRGRDDDALARLLAQLGDDVWTMPLGLDDDDTASLLASLTAAEAAPIRAPSPAPGEAVKGPQQPAQAPVEGGAVAPSQVRMVQLFFDTETHPAFIEAVQALKDLWGANLSLTDVVQRAVLIAAE